MFFLIFQKLSQKQRKEISAMFYIKFLAHMHMSSDWLVVVIFNPSIVSCSFVFSQAYIQVSACIANASGQAFKTMSFGSSLSLRLLSSCYHYLFVSNMDVEWL